MNQKRKSPASVMALGGVLAAVAVVIMSLGGLIPVATYVSPMLCAILLQMVLLFCGVRQRVERSNPPESFKGLPITLVSAAITAMSFMGFGGLVENIIAALM